MILSARRRKLARKGKRELSKEREGIHSVLALKGAMIAMYRTRPFKREGTG